MHLSGCMKTLTTIVTLGAVSVLMSDAPNAFAADYNHASALSASDSMSDCWAEVAAYRRGDIASSAMVDRLPVASHDVAEGPAPVRSAA